MTSPVETAIRGLVTPALMGVASLNRVMRRSKGPNPYLTGIHTPLKDENTFTDLKVTGSIPAGLNGVYLRNGPNPMKAPCCTACGCRTARRSGIATAGSARRR